MLTTTLHPLLSIDYPILQGGMAWAADGALAAAVSAAGGLGIIGAGNAPPEEVGRQIDRARALTDRPFGVNLMLLSPYAAEVAALTAEQRVPVVTTGADNPAPYMAAWLAAGVKVLPVVASVGLARLAERNGAAAVIAEGCESGGHIGELTTMALVPQVCDAVGIPVIAAGGIADGRGLAAALMLGAAGAQLGTAFLAAEECPAHPAYKQRLFKAIDLDTIVTGRSLGHPVRSLKTPFSRDYARLEQQGAPADQLEELGFGALRRAVVEGDQQQGCFLAGQCAGLIKEEQPAAQIIRRICEQAEQLMKGANQWVK